MGLKIGSRSGAYKAAGAKGVSSRWVSVLCIASFCFGVFVVNRLLTVPGPVRTVEDAISEDHKSQELPLLKCEKKDTSLVAGDILSQVSKTHDVIMALDKTISSLEMKLAAARSAKAEKEERSTADRKPVTEPLNNRPKVFFVMGIITAFSSRKRRDSIRETWMPQGEDLGKLEKEKGIIIRFVIGHSATPGGVLDRAIDAEDAQHNDFLRLNHVEGYHELSSKTQIYFSTVAAKWDADFFIKVDDDVHVNLGVVGSILDRHRSKPRVYIGCMKSGPVLSQKGVKYREPEYWKFGEEGNKYFRHATGQIYAISKDLATYVSINGHILHRYANEDVSLGSWFIGLDVEHIDERSLCCGTPPAICTLAKGVEATEDIDANCSYSGLESLGLFLLYGDASSLTRPRSLPYKFGFETSYKKLQAPTSIYDCEWKAQAGNTCAASFDWSCSGICKSVERMEEVHQRCGEGNGAIWHTSF